MILGLDNIWEWLQDKLIIKEYIIDPNDTYLEQSKSFLLRYRRIIGIIILCILIFIGIYCNFGNDDNQSRSRIQSGGSSNVPSANTGNAEFRKKLEQEYKESEIRKQFEQEKANIASKKAAEQAEINAKKQTEKAEADRLERKDELSKKRITERTKAESLELSQMQKENKAAMKADLKTKHQEARSAHKEAKAELEKAMAFGNANTIKAAQEKVAGTKAAKTATKANLMQSKTVLGSTKLGSVKDKMSSAKKAIGSTATGAYDKSIGKSSRALSAMGATAKQAHLDSGGKTFTEMRKEGMLSGSLAGRMGYAVTGKIKEYAGWFYEILYAIAISIAICMVVMPSISFFIIGIICYALFKAKMSKMKAY